jgi:membrane protease YdiL (CAAX protease family)
MIIRPADRIQNHLGLAVLLMWTPAISSFVARLVLREGIGDVSFRFGGKAGLKAIGVAILMPIVVGGIAYGIAWSTGLVGFSVLTPSPQRAAMTPGLAAITALPPIPRLIVFILLSATISTLVNTSACAGEEIGWRGYMLTRLYAARIPQPMFVSGVIWSLWHFPLILSGAYAAGPNPLMSSGLFLVDVMGIALVIGVLRLRSGSVWPAVFLHSAWNSIIQGPFDGSSTGPNAATIVGESGVLVAIVSLIFGLIVYRRWISQGSPNVSLARAGS